MVDCRLHYLSYISKLIILLICEQADFREGTVWDGEPGETNRSTE